MALTMHVEKVRFDEVFDIVAHRGSFSFRSGNRTHYAARLRHHVIPRPGSTFAIAFAEPGKWNTVLGWRELASPDVTLAHPAWRPAVRMISSSSRPSRAHSRCPAGRCR